MPAQMSELEQRQALLGLPRSPQQKDRVNADKLNSMAEQVDHIQKVLDALQEQHEAAHGEVMDEFTTAHEDRNKHADVIKDRVESLRKDILKSLQEGCGTASVKTLLTCLLTIIKAIFQFIWFIALTYKYIFDTSLYIANPVGEIPLFGNFLKNIFKTFILVFWVWMTMALITFIGYNASGGLYQHMGRDIVSSGLIAIRYLLTEMKTFFVNNNHMMLSDLREVLVQAGYISEDSDVYNNIMINVRAAACRGRQHLLGIDPNPGRFSPWSGCSPDFTFGGGGKEDDVLRDQVWETANNTINMGEYLANYLYLCMEVEKLKRDPTEKGARMFLINIDNITPDASEVVPVAPLPISRTPTQPYNVDLTKIINNSTIGKVMEPVISAVDNFIINRDIDVFKVKLTEYVESIFKFTIKDYSPRLDDVSGRGRKKSRKQKPRKQKSRKQKSQKQKSRKIKIVKRKPQKQSKGKQKKKRTLRR